MATFFRSWIVCVWRLAGSSSSQKGCPASVVGTRDSARTAAAGRGKMPSAMATPAPTCTAPLIFTNWAASMPVAAASGPTTFSAVPALESPLRTESSPP